MERLVPKDWWRAACEKSPQPTACVDREHRFVWVNEAWCRLLGYAAHELTGRKWQEITKVEDIGGDTQEVEAVLDGRQSNYYLEKTYIRKDHTEVPIGLNVHRFPLDLSAEITCFIVCATNRTRDHSLTIVQEEVEILKHAVAQLQEFTETQQTRDWMFDDFIPWLKKNWVYITAVASVMGSLITFLTWLISKLQSL